MNHKEKERAAEPEFDKIFVLFCFGTFLGIAVLIYPILEKFCVAADGIWG
jgi:hypothetical protein